MAKLRVKKSLSQITGAFEALVQATETHQNLDNVEESVDNPYAFSIMGVTP